MNDALMQFQADVWDGLDDVRRNWVQGREFTPRLDPGGRERLYRGWHKAVGRAREWEDR